MYLKVSLLFVLLVIQCYSQNSSYCNSTVNPLLRSADNPDGPDSLDQPQIVTGLNFCKNLEGKYSCCSAATINQLKFAFNLTLNNLMVLIKEHDAKIIQSIKVLPSFYDVQNKSKASNNEFLNSVATFIATGLKYGINLNSRILQNTQINVTNNDTNATKAQIIAQLNSIKEQFRSFQKERTTCLKYLVRLQSKFRCLACNYDYISKQRVGRNPNIIGGNPNDGRIYINPQISSNLLSNCYNYYQQSQQFNELRQPELLFAQAKINFTVISRTKTVIKKFYDLASYLESTKGQISSSQKEDVNNKIREVQTTLQQIYQITQKLNFTVTQLNSTSSEGCTNKNCYYLVQSLIFPMYGGVNFKQFLLPGYQQNFTDVRYYMNNKGKYNKRILQSSSSSVPPTVYFEYNYSTENFETNDSGFTDADQYIQEDPASAQAIDTQQIANSPTVIQDDSGSDGLGATKLNIMNLLIICIALFVIRYQ